MLKKKGFYQGLDEIKIEGCRNTEKRFEEYNIEKYLSKEKSTLDIGSNCGFVVIYLAKSVKKSSGVEINPFLVNISNDVKEFLQKKNVEYFCSKFENFEPREKFDIVCSFANDSTIDDNTDFNFREYIEKIFNLLNNDGHVFFESQALDAFVPGAFNEKREIIKEYFDILEEKMVHSEYPVGVPKRFFLILKKSNIT